MNWVYKSVINPKNPDPLNLSSTFKNHFKTPKSKSKPIKQPTPISHRQILHNYHPFAKSPQANLQTHNPRFSNPSKPKSINFSPIKNSPAIQINESQNPKNSVLGFPQLGCTFDVSRNRDSFILRKLSK